MTQVRRVKTTRVLLQMYPIDQIVLEVTNKFRAIDMEAGTSYAKRYTQEWLRHLIRASLDRIAYKGNMVSRENKQRILSAFGNLRRPGSKSIRYRVEPKNLTTVSTADRPRDSISLGVLNRGVASIFYDDTSKGFDGELSQAITQLEADDRRPVRALTRVDNRFSFRTPLAVLITHSEPEFRFVKALVHQKNAPHVKAWIKSTDTDFYEIEYSYPRGDFSKRATFNPDFILQLESGTLVIEIKGNEEIDSPSPENRGKWAAAVAYFAEINRLQDETVYHFCFLSPDDYDLFFDQLQKGQAMAFQSSLDLALSQ